MVDGIQILCGMNIVQRDRFVVIVAWENYKNII